MTSIARSKITMIALFAGLMAASAGAYPINQIAAGSLSDNSTMASIPESTTAWPSHNVYLATCRIESSRRTPLRRRVG